MVAKLVVIGDSISQGFMSGSISRTDISYPAMIAKSLNDDDFLVPDFAGEDGLPLNIESLLRILAERYGSSINLLELPLAAISAYSYLDRVEDYWERGRGSMPTKPMGVRGDYPSTDLPLHRNLAVWGFELADCDTISEGLCRRVISPATDDMLPTKQLVEFSMYRTARRTLNPLLDDRYQALTQLDAAKEIKERQGGIENLIFFLGANNCLATVMELGIDWSEQADIRRFAHQRKCNLWQPEHFRRLLDRVVPKINEIGADRVFIGTIPHITILPVARGVSLSEDASQWRDDKGYFEYYTHFWIWDDEFRKAPKRFPHLTREEARLIDATIDEYNAAIKEAADKNGWHVVDLYQLLEDLAYRRQFEKPRFKFPPELVAALEKNPLTKERVIRKPAPVPAAAVVSPSIDERIKAAPALAEEYEVCLDTRYFHLNRKAANPKDKYEGGLFSLDGVHPTTIGYGIIANEFLKVMEDAGVKASPLNWDEIVAADTLVTDLPANVANLRKMLGFLSSKTPLPELIKIIGGDLTNPGRD